MFVSTEGAFGVSPFAPYDVASDWTASWNAGWCDVQGGTACDQSLVFLSAPDTRMWIEFTVSDDVDDGMIRPAM